MTDIISTCIYIPYSMALESLIIGFDVFYICMSFFIAYRIKCLCFLAKTIGENNSNRASSLELIKLLSTDHWEIFRYFIFISILLPVKFWFEIWFNFRFTRMYSNSISFVLLVETLGTLLWISFVLVDDQNVKRRNVINLLIQTLSFFRHSFFISLVRFYC